MIATDSATNSTSRSATFTVDTTAPATTDDAPTTYQSTPVEVTLAATDAGSGVAHTYYEVGDDPTDPTTASTIYDAASKPTLQPGQRIKYFSVDDVGNAEPTKTPTVQGPRATEQPVISGILQSGQTVTASDGQWADGALELHYQWLSCDSTTLSCTPVGDDAPRLALTDDERGRRLRITVTASNPYGSAIQTSGATNAVGLPAVNGSGAFGPSTNSFEIHVGGVSGSLFGSVHISGTDANGTHTIDAAPECLAAGASGTTAGILAHVTRAVGEPATLFGVLIHVADGGSDLTDRIDVTNLNQAQYRRQAAVGCPAAATPRMTITTGDVTVQAN